MCWKKTNKQTKSLCSSGQCKFESCLQHFPIFSKMFPVFVARLYLGFQLIKQILWRHKNLETQQETKQKKHGTHLVSASLNLACNIFHFLCIVSSVALKFLRCQKIKQSIHWRQKNAHISSASSNLACNIFPRSLHSFLYLWHGSIKLSQVSNTKKINTL